MAQVVHPDGEVDAAGLHGGHPDAGAEGVAGDRGAGGGGEQRLVAADAVGADVERDGFEPGVVDAELWFPPNRGGFLYAASRSGAAVFS